MNWRSPKNPERVQNCKAWSLEASLKTKPQVLNKGPFLWHSVHYAETRQLLDPTGSRLGLQIYLWPRVTLTFDLLTPKVDRFIPLPHGPFMPTGIKTGSFVFMVFTSLVTYGQRYERMDRLRTLRFHVPVWPSGGIRNSSSRDKWTLNTHTNNNIIIHRLYYVLTLCGLALRSNRMTRPRVQRTNPWRNPSLWM